MPLCNGQVASEHGQAEAANACPSLRQHDGVCCLSQHTPSSWCKSMACHTQETGSGIQGHRCRQLQANRCCDEGVELMRETLEGALQ